MRIARSVLLTLAVLLAFGAPLPATAQDGGVGFVDMPGLQEAISRTCRADVGFDSATGDAALRDLRKPAVSLMLTAVYSFDTEANAAAAYQLLQTDMNATGMSGQALELTPITLPVTLEHTAAIAVDDSSALRYEFSLAMAHDGVYVYTVIAITTGAPAQSGVAAILRDVATRQVGTAPASFNAAGTSTGGLWGKVPTRAEIERVFRGITTVEDAAPFPA